MSATPDPARPGADSFPGVTLLLGGARSGKSSLAVQLGEAWQGPVVFVATARTDADDADLLARVQRHRAERPPHWSTIEAPVEVVAAVRHAPEAALVIVDCITLWVASAIDPPPSSSPPTLPKSGTSSTTAVPQVPDFDGGRIERDAAQLVEVAVARRSPTVFVSNEVGLGLHPMSDLGRAYRDTLGRVNAVLASRARRTLFLAAGRAVRLDDPWTLLT
jgi:adenosylcobinamide kinase/adenosylcobinamide-phosphate guanylyltransferase